mmetsp:Transcript_44716/g.93815  ORF Transcript_44716/g.93815 Transcript_44716/m.93815 type:complete len:468 (-) Transcript_44716:37-1440(-)
MKTSATIITLLSTQSASAFVLPSSNSAPLSRSSSATIVPSSASPSRQQNQQHAASMTTALRMAEDASASSATEEIAKAPSLNGKMVLPTKAMMAGLKGHKVAAVYAILNKNYKRGSGDGWEHVQHVSITRDLHADLAYYSAAQGPTNVAYARAMSFSYPQKATMLDFANGWKGRVLEVGGALMDWGAVREVAAEEAAAEESETATTVESTIDEDLDDDDDDDDEEFDHEDYLEMMAQSRAAVAPPPPAPLFVDNTGLSGIESLSPKTDDEPNTEEVISPFDSAVQSATEAASAATATLLTDGESILELNAENVDKVLDEVRPYLISDGGNVSVQNVDPDSGNVELLLEGACGSCASSTVTMKMGIERVLKEQFGTKLGEVIQVDPEEGGDGGEDGTPKELTMEAVQAEVNRISTAIIAMGGVVRVLSVDGALGVVEIEFRGPNRVQKGLELALLDVEFVKHVKFVST